MYFSPLQAFVDAVPSIWKIVPFYLPIKSLSILQTLLKTSPFLLTCPKFHTKNVLLITLCSHGTFHELQYFSFHFSRQVCVTALAIGITPCQDWVVCQRRNHGKGGPCPLCVWAPSPRLPASQIISWEPSPHTRLHPSRPQPPWWHLCIHLPLSKEICWIQKENGPEPPKERKWGINQQYFPN